MTSSFVGESRLEREGSVVVSVGTFVSCTVGVSIGTAGTARKRS